MRPLALLRPLEVGDPRERVGELLLRELQLGERNSGADAQGGGGFGAQAAASERPTDARSRRREELRHARSTDAARCRPAGRHRRRDAHAM